MSKLSLRIRSLLLAVLALLVFIPVTVFTLDSAYTRSLTQAKLNELKLMNLALVSAFELDGEIPYMPELLYEEQLNLPDSGYIGLIMFRGKVVWKSASALHNQIATPPPPPAVGDDEFKANYIGAFNNSRGYFSYVFTAEFAAEQGFEPVQFYIFNDRSEFNAERKAFLSTLWQWMLVLAVGLLVLITFGMSVVLAPVREIIREIGLTAKGSQSTIAGDYPREFDGLKTSINQLIEAEAQQRSRYKNSLDDLAHSLKTPLAVAMGTPKLPGEAIDALSQIDSIIQRQLKRAAASKGGWQASIDVYPVAKKICAAMQKVHRKKNLDIRLTDAGEPSTPIKFRGDNTDLMEMLGNLMDNACKAADCQVYMHIDEKSDWIYIAVEDDGPGIPEHIKKRLLQRGKRLDTYSEGQGIGMAVVSDLVAIYEGRLDITPSPLGGAKVILRFPKPTLTP